MVYPVSSPVAQQIPAANTFQPGGQADALKRTEQDNSKIDNSAPQPDAARTQNLNTKPLDNSSSSLRASDRAEDTGGITASADRGLTVDLSV